MEMVKHSAFSPSALLSQEKEARNDAEPQSSQPSEIEVALQETINCLQQEKEAITAQYQAQVCITLFSPITDVSNNFVWSIYSIVVIIS